ncbi:RING finger domain protein [Xylona heveae TC161]|uniref:RING finger domain protein n=1 Tax=Xylona heveae (strain CBS 132557 / TC161) TaxID=1328760 RepID=A0A165A6B8_XYLHT|nr:RING finger domain protein [Xylona heveae TC161]KZF20013.1 RING finger domain protein [Xylona heveae TC161]
METKQSKPPGAFRDEWDWPSDLPADQPRAENTHHNEHARTTEGTRSNPRPQQYWPPRTCRICLETVLPSFEPQSEFLPTFLQSAPKVSYVSADPDYGRLISPCKCKGSSRYVHEGCLQAWRNADPGYGRRNYWQCPTCGFRYKLERMRWGRWISSTATQISMTLIILFLTMFILGFVADPIINFYLDPYSTLVNPPRFQSRTKIEPVLLEEGSPWIEHFLKGLASLGLLSFVKVLLAMSPWQWWNLRNSGLVGGGRPGGSGRDRLASLSWTVVFIGVCTFLWGVYRGVRAWSRRVLVNAGERVMDVQSDEDDEDATQNERKKDL